MVQRLEGRPDRNAPGDGHCDAVLAVDAHPKLSVIASGALEKDCTVKLWADSSDPSVSARPGMFDAAIRNAAADAAAAASAQLPPAAPTAAPEQACTLSASAGDEHLSFVACHRLVGYPAPQFYSIKTFLSTPNFGSQRQIQPVPLLFDVSLKQTCACHWQHLKRQCVSGKIALFTASTSHESTQSKTVSPCELYIAAVDSFLQQSVCVASYLYMEHPWMSP